VIELHRSIQAEINRAALGLEREVLIERMARSPGDLLGRTESNKVVAFPGSESRIGQFTTVRLLNTSGSTFSGIEVSLESIRVA
jgi:tRNA A37 methylthiotransferase MiaB